MESNIRKSLRNVSLVYRIDRTCNFILSHVFPFRPTDLTLGAQYDIVMFAQTNLQYEKSMLRQAKNLIRSQKNDPVALLSAQVLLGQIAANQNMRHGIMGKEIENSMVR